LRGKESKLQRRISNKCLWIFSPVAQPHCLDDNRKMEDILTYYTGYQTSGEEPFFSQRAGLEGERVNTWEFLFSRVEFPLFSQEESSKNRLLHRQLNISTLK